MCIRDRLPAIVKNNLHGDAKMLGFLMASSAIGALVGAIYLAQKHTTEKLLKIIPVASLVLAFGLIGFSFSKNFYFSFLSIFITGFGMITQMASTNTVLQSLVDEEKRGRVMSFYVMAFMGMTPFGSLFAGSLSSVIGTSNTLAIAGIVCVIGAYFLPQRKSL